MMVNKPAELISEFASDANHMQCFLSICGAVDLASATFPHHNCTPFLFNTSNFNDIPYFWHINPLSKLPRSCLTTPMHNWEKIHADWCLERFAVSQSLLVSQT